MIGRVVGLVLVTILSDVIKRLAIITEEELKAILQISLDEFGLRKKTALAGINGLKENKSYDSSSLEIMETVFRSRSSSCRISVRPAKTRYDGIMTNNGVKGSTNGGFWKGDDSKLALSRPSLPSNNPIPLMYYPTGRGVCTNNTEVDFIDVFLARGADDWLTLSFPNSLEIETYGEAPAESLIHICTLVCPWGKCPSNEVHLGHILPEKGPKVEMEINGLRVTNTTSTSNYCYFMRHENGWKWKANDNDQYGIRVRVNDQSSTVLRLTSFTAFSTDIV